MAFRILSLDGGGSRGVYTLGILNEVERAVGSPLYQHVDLIYGTSTGSIIGTLIALGKTIPEIKDLYFEYVPKIMKGFQAKERSRRLEAVSEKIFGDAKFDQVKTGIGVVAMNYDDSQPLIFKADVRQAYSRQATFLPGFGCTISTAIQASCAAFPIFRKKQVVTANQGTLIAVDGGFIANNPVLFAITDATGALKHQLTDLRILSVGTGNFVEKEINLKTALIRKLKFVQLFERTMKANSKTTELLVKFLFPQLNIVRVNETFNQPQYGTNMVESDKTKLNILFRIGRDSYAKCEQEIKSLFIQ
jgi:patatin-like phospholipase/acyl hydrolase